MMVPWKVQFSFLLVLFINHVNGDDRKCIEHLLEAASFSTSSGLEDQDPDNITVDGENYWTAANTDFEQFLVIDLGTPNNVTGIATQGRPGAPEYVEEFNVSYSNNGLDYEYFLDPEGNVKLFEGNKNGDDIKRNVFEVPILAQYIRINPTRWNNQISIRVGLYYCEYEEHQCTGQLLEVASYSASSGLEDESPVNIALDGENYWTAARINFEQLLVIDLGTLKNVTGIGTQGRPGSSEWIAKFTVSYSNNGLNYVDIEKPGGKIKIFQGNINGDDIKRNMFEVPILAQYIRINPYQWRNQISLRVGLYDCYFEDYTECSKPLLGDANFSASSSLEDRGPDNIRLDGEKFWTAANIDSEQYLVIDLGTPKNVTSIATQGRPGSPEYVKEFIVSYSTNGLNYTNLEDSEGNVKLFKGNNNGDAIRRNVFAKPITALYVRINPTRWRKRISLRVELYGCNYEGFKCNGPLLEGASISASSSMEDREPDNIRLNGEDFWKAARIDFNQYLVIDLGTSKNITSIATQGRPESSEYVAEFIVSYSTNGFDYVDFKEPEGNAKIFEGNKNGDDIQMNVFEVPILAQYIRINPIRWRNGISLRVELYGCDYVADNLYFNGSALVRWDLLRSPISASQETIRFSFKTNHADGVMLYGRGTQGDYIALQLRDNRMLLNLDLGSGQVTSLSLGSLLDDNIWHDVVVSRNRRDIMLSIDKVVVKGKVKDEFTRLNLDRELYIGGVPNLQEGLVVNRNFTGCMENLYFNSTNFIRSVKEPEQEEDHDRYSVENVHTLFNCPDHPYIPVTFLTNDSYVQLEGHAGADSLNVSLSFRTYEENGMLIFHKFTSDGAVTLFLKEGHLKIRLRTGSEKTLLDNFPDNALNDGRWHQVALTISTNSLVLEVDGQPMTTTRQLSISTGGIYLIAGGKSGTTGYIGCMRLISIDGNYKLPTNWTRKEFCCKDEVVLNSCQIVDKCNPNPCRHEGVCRQNSQEFWCECADTGYSGAICHASEHPLSCEAYKNTNDVGQSKEIKVDMDGSGPLPPFPVTCKFQDDGKILTLLGHNKEHESQVDGFQEPGSFVEDIVYEADVSQIKALINRSISCRQRLQYACKKSKLLNSPTKEDEPFQPFSWWVSRNNQKMDYWSGALPSSRMCECGILGTCIDPTKWCNCDSEMDTWLVDGGDITQMEHLPVKQLRIGDTGTPLDDKEGQYTLGPLVCEGDNLFNNVVTFRIPDATINLPTFDMGDIRDIYFEFKTTVENAVILHSQGTTNSIKILLSRTRLHFSYQSNYGHIGMSVQPTYQLADNNWHSVYVESNRKEALIVVDHVFNSSVKDRSSQYRPIHLTSDLVLGANKDKRQGYVGCMRALLLNGQPVDLRKHAERNLYGISSGCVGKCESSPCLNNGTCHEGYDDYSCDCQGTAFKGPICASEAGVKMRSNSYIKYNFMGTLRSTISEKIRVGFTTTKPKGFLLGLFSNISGEYMTIEVSKSGHLHMVFDFGFDRQEMTFSNQNFALGQYHDVRITRADSGSRLIMQVDNYEPKEFRFHLKESIDAQFNDIQSLYIGRNETMTEGFVGCISRVEFDDIFPVKLFFEDSPSIEHSGGNSLRDSFCGVEPVTHPPNTLETTAPPEVNDQPTPVTQPTEFPIIMLG